MFDRFVRLAQARKAFLAGHLEEVLRLVDDPLIRDERKAIDLRLQAVDALVERARRRAAGGALSAARQDCERALAWVPGAESALRLGEELRQRTEDQQERSASARPLCRDARQVLERGDPALARRLVDQAAVIFDGPDVVELRQRIADQQLRAVESLARAKAASAAGRVEEAVDALAVARALDRQLEGASEVGTGLAVRAETSVLAELRSALRAGGVQDALATWARQRSRLPELETQPGIRAELDRLGHEGRRRVLEALQAGDIEGAIDLAAREPLADEGLATAIAQLGRAVAMAARGEFREAGELAAGIGASFAVEGLARRAARWREAAERVDPVLASARRSAAEGRLVEAREVLLTVIAEHPEHAAARREIDMLDQGAEDRARRIAAARDKAREGCLREAAAMVVTLAAPGPEGDEARVLLRDLHQRIDTVAAGLRQVMRSLHGRDSATRDGLVHSLRRLDELEKVQADSEELARIRTATEAEIEGLDRIRAAREALARGDADALRGAVQGLADARPRLLAPDRLDARVLELVDEVLAEADRALAASRPGRADALSGALRPWAVGGGPADRRIGALVARVAESQVRAAHLVAVAADALARRDLDAALAAVEEARGVAADDPGVERIEAEVAALRHRGAQLEQVSEMAGQRDFEAAQRKLDDMGPTPSLMRTRIYDLRRNLAAAQGLDGPFLLRVDEGGEYLVVRGETLTIGNLRDGGSDLPMLANLAGCHARLRRTLSFHGGQEDRIEAERGEVFVDGHPVAVQRLVSGRRVRLGRAVELLYRVPSERSLTAVLSIRGGFQVAGTDTVLWMKDRGRDGRILIGPTTDCHVQVGRARGVVEIFAGRDGQIRVRSDEGGTIDGRPFQGEHPATAGCPIECAGVSFVLQPWNRI
jgi:hypothetical protein